MQQTSQQSKLNSIFKMLLEMASGNLLYRITLHEEDDELNRISASLNITAERLLKVLATLESPNPHRTFLLASQNHKETDSQLIQKVYTYILNNLSEPLPSIKELSKTFNTNPYKLKRTFKRFFNTGIHQFYNEERLKKAHFLITETNLPLKEIAYSCGFNSYLHFYKSFKQKYHYAPTALKRKPLSE